MALMAATLFPARRGREDERWGGPVLMSLAAHAFLGLLFVMSGAKGPTAGDGPVLTEVNFLEKPVEVQAPPVPDPAAGLPDSAAQSPAAQPAQTVLAFAHPSSPVDVPSRAEPVNAPIIPNAPIMPLGQVGAIGTRKAALAPLPSQDATTVKKGPVPLPMSGGGRGTNVPIALNTQQVDDVRRGGGGGPVIPLSMAGGGSGSAGAPGTGKALAPVAGSSVSQVRKAPMETLKATPLGPDAWGKKNSPFSLEGPLKYRKIRAMQMPPYPRWAEEQGLEATVSFRIWVDAKGKVKDNMYLEKTSGHAELDNLVKEALLKFVFVPLPDDQPAEDEWGVATFRFELKK